MAEILDYETYENEAKPLSDQEALTAYQKEKAMSPPDAIVYLRQVDKDSWKVSTYASERERNDFLHRRYLGFLRRAFASLVK